MASYSYYDQQKDANHSREIMYYFAPDKLPILTTLARSYALFNGWFSFIPGPTLFGWVSGVDIRGFGFLVPAVYGGSVASVSAVSRHALVKPAAVQRSGQLPAGCKRKVVSRNHPESRRQLRSEIPVYGLFYTDGK